MIEQAKVIGAKEARVVLERERQERAVRCEARLRQVLEEEDCQLEAFTTISRGRIDTEIRVIVK